MIKLGKMKKTVPIEKQIVYKEENMSRNASFSV